MSYQLIKSDSVDCPVSTPETDPNKTPEHTIPKKISRQQLVNKLNFINFQDETILINFKHNKFGHVFSWPAKPQPSMGEEVLCTWVDAAKLKNKLKTYEFDSILLKDRQCDLKLRLEVIDLNEEFIRFQIPEICFQTSSKKSMREPCHGIRAQMFQNSAIFKGTLIDFCATEFSVKITLEPPQTSQWLNPDVPINILLSRDEETLYSGECKIVEETSNGSTIDFLLEPTNNSIQRFKRKRFRSIREDITPAPVIRFTHPITGKRYDFKVADLSGSGFSVEETENTCALLPGIILPDVEMIFANSFKIHFRTQVVYRNNTELPESGEVCKCGLALLDITTHDHLNLQSILLQLRNKNAYICSDLDIDSLWDFLFETGFIYPEKYNHIQNNSENIKNTYEKIYSGNPSIARYFTYQNKGLIAGHLSMLRFYENTWLIHHHAGRKATSFNAGLVVLNQIGHYSNNSHSLYSNHMNYLICYFRPENKFPNRVFGGAARTINDENKCDIESFAYFHFNGKTPIENKHNISWNWSLNPSEPEDIEELDEFYSHSCGGLMLKALNIESNKFKLNGLSDEYRKIGLKRERHFFSLKHDNILVAVIMVNVSNKGLNLSDLTNATKVIILDSEKLPEHVLKTVLHLISARIKAENFPVLVHPVNYLIANSVPFEKIYNLWMLDTQFGDTYFRYVNRLTRLI